VKVSVIVPAFNEEKLLANTLAHIQRAMASFTQRGWETELVVCNNNSTDRTAEIAQAAGARVVFEPVNQIARARNAGAGTASGDWFVFVDADSRPSPELFADVANAIATGKYLGGGSTVRMDEYHFLGELLTRGWNIISRLNKWMAGSFIFCEAEAFRAIGGFSRELFAAEELDMSKRLKKLARLRGKRLTILHRHPLVTSARKMKLYTPRELLGFIRRAAFAPRQTLSNRAACQPWYDGRR
jgi:glycosyltransferase involved in cell wall biosynthesis